MAGKKPGQNRSPISLKPTHTATTKGARYELHQGKEYTVLCSGLNHWIRKLIVKFQHHDHEITGAAFRCAFHSNTCIPFQLPAQWTLYTGSIGSEASASCLLSLVSVSRALCVALRVFNARFQEATPEGHGMYCTPKYLKTLKPGSVVGRERSRVFGHPAPLELLR
ncbi:hypothetical protein M430DRAFT_248459 [Amorphotheca resinae ATCC 22711]|jgi:hypothetical protein|uniref:Uncharacterized protein n=1 Tax=Amorphotheca resinae ATCC 22711 TaxID=857342 RepID=A0A2T3B059_AMORE|nr:hypothetical protein M430DRAFT_248459 [Amorphotheca resinae ATCC 22711]PSS16789.1 hypothetical protein M430DRAFT_248459 [Amorphotheca resinae ATCC 22711]